MRKSILLFFLALAMPAFTAEVSMKVKNRYLNIPVFQKSERRHLTFQAKGVPDLTVWVRLPEGEPEYWVFKDVSAYKGKTLKLTCQGADELLSRIFQADSIMGENGIYREVNRPQFHFTTRRGWINDPNGLLFHDGEYHLYYQHNPYEREWENMHWGHAVSRDLIHWEELNDALYPDTLGTMFSGSAVFDARNTSGFGTAKNPPLVYAYTADGKFETQALAYSLDRGRTLIKYDGNPVIDSHLKWNSHDTRDPRLFWYEPGGHWVMVLNERDGHSIYTSPNLRDWTFQSHVTGFWECPDLFALPVDGNPQDVRWVMYGASGTYMLGDFDGKTFRPTAGKYRYTAGTIYAAQTFNGMTDGRRIQIGWGRVSHPGMPFNGMMLLPTELTLRQTRDGVRLASRPVREVESLLQRQYEGNAPLSEAEANEVLKKTCDLSTGIHLRARLHLNYATSAGLSLNGQNIVDYDMNQNILQGWPYSPQSLTSMDLDVEVFIDRTSVEVFVEDGLFSYSLERRLGDNHDGLRFWGREITVSSLQIDRVQGIW